MEDRTFGELPAADILDAESSPLDALRAEFGRAVRRKTSVTLKLWSVDDEGNVLGRDGWWARFDTAFEGAAMEKLIASASRGRQSGSPDALKAASLVIVETCQAIGTGATTVFGDGAGRPLKTGEVVAALRDLPQWSAVRAAAGAEPEWLTAVRWMLGAFDLDDDGRVAFDDRPILQMGAAIQAANSGETGRLDETDPTV